MLSQRWQLTEADLQRYRRGHNEHDWKSCDGQKPSEGSNPSRCAKTRNRGTAMVLRFFLRSQRFSGLQKSQVVCSFCKRKDISANAFADELQMHSVLKLAYLPHYAVINPLIYDFQTVHQLVHNGPCPFRVTAYNGPQEITVAIVADRGGS